MGISLEFAFNAINNVTGTIDKVSKSMSNLSNKSGDLREGFEDLESQFNKIGQAANQAFGMATNAIREAIDVGAEYEFTLAGMSGALKGLNPDLEHTTINFDELNRTIFDLATLSGESTQKIARGAKLLAEAGLTLEESQSTLNEAILLATVPGQDFDRVVGILVSTVRSLGLELHETSKVVDAFAGISLATGIDEIDTVARTFGLASGAMQEFGVELGDVAGIIALLSESFVVAAGGIESFTLVGNTMVAILDKSGKAGLFTNQVQQQLIDTLGEESAEMGKLQRVLVFLRREMNAGNISAEQVNEAFGLTGRTAQGMTKLLKFSEKEFVRLTDGVNQAGIAQRNFNEVATSTQRRLGALNAVVEQIQILFFTGLAGALGDSLSKFFDVISGPEGNRAAVVIKEIGEGFGTVLGPAIDGIIDAMDTFLGIMEFIGPSGRQAIGAVAAISIGFIGMLASLRLLLPVFKVLIGMFGPGNPAVAFSKTILTIGRGLGLAGNTLGIFARGLELMGKAFLPLAGVIGTVKGLFKLFVEGADTIVELVEGIGALSGGILAFAALIPGPQQPLIALLALIIALIDAFQLWDDILQGFSDISEFLGLGAFDIDKPLDGVQSASSLFAGGERSNTSTPFVQVNVQGDIIGEQGVIDRVVTGIEAAEQVNRNSVE